MRKRKFFVFITAVLMTNPIIFSQPHHPDTTNRIPPGKEPKISNWIFGGYVALQFGTITLIDVSPQIGYIINPTILVGSGVTYQYYRQKWYDEIIKSSIYGGRVFTEYIIYNEKSKRPGYRPRFSIYTHFEYELMNLDRDFSNTTSALKSRRFWVDGILIGGGFKQNIGRRSSLNISILYNIIYDKRTPYDNPQIRIGFYF